MHCTTDLFIVYDVFSFDPYRYTYGCIKSRVLLFKYGKLINEQERGEKLKCMNNEYF